MMSRRRSKRTPGDWVMCVPGGRAIIQQGFARVLGSGRMPSEEPQESFKVTDRRRRGDDESSVPPRAAAPAPAPPDSAPPVAHDPDRSLVGLFMMLGGSAMMALGEPDPSTGQRGQHDLPMAAEVIDVLTLPREKTEGRRSPEESSVLDELLYDLQIRYVNATKRSERR